MPRQARVLMENVGYHAITRGNQKKVVFKEYADYEKYLKILSRYKQRYHFKLYGWCLMPNHVHLVVESDVLSKVMHAMSLVYAQYYKKKYPHVGHFWQDRFKSPVIEKDRYMVNCIRYIEDNPVRAHLVERPEDYPWSSYRARVLGHAHPLLDQPVFS